MMNREGVGLCERFELADDAVELVEQRGVAMGAQDVGDAAEIPERAGLAAGETVPDERADLPMVFERRTGVVQFVGRSDEPDAGRGGAKMIEKGLFAGLPRRLDRLIGVAAGADEIGDRVAEATTDFGERGGASLVFDGVMQQGGDGFVLAAAMFQNERSHGKKVRDVRDVGPFATLSGMELRGVDESLLEAGRERHEREFNVRAEVKRWSGNGGKGNTDCKLQIDDEAESAERDDTGLGVKSRSDKSGESLGMVTSRRSLRAVRAVRSRAEPEERGGRCLSNAGLFYVGGAAGDVVGLASFAGAEFGPDGKMIGDEEGLFHGEVELAHQIEDAGAAGELGRGAAIEDDVVVEMRAVSVRREAGNGTDQKGDLAQAVEMEIVGVEIAQQNDVVFIAAVVANGADDVGEGVKFARHGVGLGVDVDQREGERFGGRRTTGAEGRDHRFALEAVARIVHGINAFGIDLDTGPIVDERVLLFADRTAESRTYDKVVVGPFGVDHLDEARQDILSLGANFLDGHDVEPTDDLGQNVHDLRMVELLLAEDLNVERSDTERIALTSGGRRAQMTDADRAIDVSVRSGFGSRAGLDREVAQAVKLVALKEEVPGASEDQQGDDELGRSHGPLLGPWNVDSEVTADENANGFPGCGMIAEASQPLQAGLASEAAAKEDRRLGRALAHLVDPESPACFSGGLRGLDGPVRAE
jgi:hypothetical protein